MEATRARWDPETATRWDTPLAENASSSPRSPMARLSPQTQPARIARASDEEGSMDPSTLPLASATSPSGGGDGSRERSLSALTLPDTPCALLVRPQSSSPLGLNLPTQVKRSRRSSGSALVSHTEPAGRPSLSARQRAV